MIITAAEYKTFCLQNNQQNQVHMIELKSNQDYLEQAVIL